MGLLSGNGRVIAQDGDRRAGHRSGQLALALVVNAAQDWLGVAGLQVGGD
jgi:hypothetical protein